MPPISSSCRFSSPAAAPARSPRWYAGLAAGVLCLPPAHAGSLGDQAHAMPAPVVQVRAAAAAVNERIGAVLAKTVIRRDEIERYGDSTVVDVLARVPGLTIDRSRSRGVEIQMRGLGNGYTQLLLNGEAAPNGFAIDSLAPNAIERIEILRTPTADTSAQGIAGAINIVLRSAQSQLRRELKFLAASENGGRTGNLTGQLGGEIGTASYLLTPALSREYFSRPARLLDTGSDTVGAPLLLRDTLRNGDNRMDTFNLLATVKQKLAGGDTLALESLWTARRTDGASHDRGRILLGAAPEYTDNDVNYRVDNLLLHNTLKWTHRIGDYGNLHVDAGSRLGRRRTSTVFDGYDELPQLVVRRNVDTRADDRELSINGKYSTPLAASHMLAAGWQASNSERRETRLQLDANPTGRPPMNLDEGYDADVRKLSLFAQDEWTLDPRWNMYFGVRWEILRTSTAGNVLARVGNHSSVVSPIFQTAWGIPGLPNDQLRFGLSRSYKAPQTVELIPRRFLSTSNSPTSPDTQGNPELRPELAWGVDAAWERSLAGKGLFAITGYLRRIDDVILQQMARNGERWVSAPVNAGQASVRGIGVEYKTILNTLVAGWPAVALRASADRNWSNVERLAGPHNRLERQQPLSAALGADYQVSPTFSGGASFKFLGSRLARTSETQSAYAGARRTLDAYALWRLAPSSQLRLSVLNALHRDNATAARYSDGMVTLDQQTLSSTYTAVRLMLELKL